MVYFISRGLPPRGPFCSDRGGIIKLNCFPEQLCCIYTMAYHLTPDCTWSIGWSCWFCFFHSDLRVRSPIRTWHTTSGSSYIPFYGASLVQYFIMIVIIIIINNFLSRSTRCYSKFTAEAIVILIVHPFSAWCHKCAYYFPSQSGSL